MANTITIPSPSVLLRSPPSQSKRSVQTDRDNVPTQSNVSKKRKRAPAKAGSKISTKAFATESKRTKSRNGCSTCKVKRLKCDEVKPSCGNCQRRKVTCGGYKKEFKWRCFDETTNFKVSAFSAPTATDEPRETKQQRTDKAPSSQKPDESLEDVPPPDEDDQSTEQTVRTFEHILTPPDEDINFERDDNDQGPEQQQDEATAAPQNDECKNSEKESIRPHEPDPAIGNNASVVSNQKPSAEVQIAQLEEPPDEHEPFDTAGSDAPPEDPIEEIERFASSPFQSTTMDLVPFIGDTSSDETIYSEAFQQLMDSIPDSPLLSLYVEPTFPEAAPEMLALRFDRYTSGILSVKDGPEENPWRTLIWPMTHNSAALHHAMLAVSAFQSSRDVPALREVGRRHNGLSLENLFDGINDGTMNLDTAIATCLALGFAQSWDLLTSTGNEHINGARHLIQIALSKHRESPLDGVNLDRMKFLCNAWVYMDVIARLTSTSNEDTDDYESIFSAFKSPDVQHDGFGIDFGLTLDCEMDPLMGCASTLFPVIGRTTTLVRRVRRTSVNGPAIISQAMELKSLLEDWSPPEYIAPPSDPSSNVQESIQTAEAYRWATLLFLRQTVPEIPALDAVEMANKVMCFLATTRESSRFVTVQLFPLMAAGCEATDAETRGWVTKRWAAMARRLRIRSIDNCLAVTEEVWRRRDERNVRPSLHSRMSSSATSWRRQDSQGEIDMVDEQLGDPIVEDLDGVDIATLLPAMTGRGYGASQRRYSSRASMSGNTDSDYSVRGKLHWLGVMQDWNWEVLLG